MLYNKEHEDIPGLSFLKSILSYGFHHTHMWACLFPMNSPKRHLRRSHTCHTHNIILFLSLPLIKSYRPVSKNGISLISMNLFHFTQGLQISVVMLVLALGVIFNLSLELYPAHLELRVLFQILLLTLVSIWPWVNSDLLEGKLSRQRTVSYGLPWIWNVSPSDLCLWHGLFLYNPK